MSASPPGPEAAWFGRVAILTGESGCGKTTACGALAHRARARALSCAGLVCPGRFEGDRKVGIDVVDVRSGERLPLASLTGGPDSIRLGPWHFDPAAISWARASLAEACPCDILVVDEIGPLEMERAEGWPEALHLVRAGDYRAAVVVVRPSLVGAVCAALGNPEPAVFGELRATPSHDALMGALGPLLRG